MTALERLLAAAKDLGLEPVELAPNVRVLVLPDTTAQLGPDDPDLRAAFERARRDAGGAR